MDLGMYLRDTVNDDRIKGKITESPIAICIATVNTILPNPPLFTNRQNEDAKNALTLHDYIPRHTKLLEGGGGEACGRHHHQPTDTIRMVLAKMSGHKSTQRESTIKFMLGRGERERTRR